MHQREPNNSEQDVIYKAISNEISIHESGNLLFAIYGMAGTGKSSVAKKLMVFARSCGKLALCCASTTKAAEVFGNDCVTAHSLFKYPVIEDIDRDPELYVQCHLENTDRAELLAEVEVIIWDEFMSNHKEILEAALIWCPKAIFIVMGDFRQVLPIITRGDKSDIIEACCGASYLWSRFTKYQLSMNMRIINSGCIRQRRFMDMLVALGEGFDNADAVVVHEVRLRRLRYFMYVVVCILMIPNYLYECVIKVPEEDRFVVGFPTIEYYLDSQKEEALNWLLSGKGFSGSTVEELSGKAILCTTNRQVRTHVLYLVLRCQ
jgi:hypothetical protein